MTVIENQRLGAVEDKLGALEDKMDRVLEALTGDDFGLNGGLVSKVKALEERVTAIETLKNRIMWGVAGFGFTGGITAIQLFDFLKRLLNH